jgi:hypothetical protein
MVERNVFGTDVSKEISDMTSRQGVKPFPEFC